MYRRFLFPLIIIALLFSACASAEPQFMAGEAEAPMEEPMPEEAMEAERSAADFAGEGLDSSAAPQTTERLVIRTADLRIVVDRPEETMEDIALMAERMGGFVVTSNLRQTMLERGVEVPQANITVRVPSERLNEALEEIESQANRVDSRNVSGEDVTQQYTDISSRLRNLQEAEEQLLLIMEDARQTEDVLAVFDELTRVREQIEVYQGQIQYFEQAAALSAISVNLIASEAVQPITAGGWEPAAVVRNALQALVTTLQGLAGAGIWLVLYLLPVVLLLALPLALLWWIFRRWRARRKAAPATSAE